MSVTKGIAQLWKTLPPPVQGGIALVTVAGGTYVGVRQYKKYQEKQRIKKAEKIFNSSLKPVTVMDGSGNAVTVNINTAVTATKIHDAIYNNDWFGATEDEEAIVKALQLVPRPYMPEIANNYYNLYKKNLQEDVIKALSTNEWEKVSYLF